jgi:hypothetical protein
MRREEVQNEIFTTAEKERKAKQKVAVKRAEYVKSREDEELSC